MFMASFKKEVVAIDDADGKITRLILNGAFQGENFIELKSESWESRISWKLTTVNRQRTEVIELIIESEIEKLRLPRRSAGSSGNLLELGVYFYKMTTDNRQQTTVI